LVRILSYTLAARLDLEAAFEWLSQPGSGRRAQRRIQHIAAAIDRLVEHPCRHPRSRHGRREFTVEGHRVVYRVTPDTGRDATGGDVTVLRVFGPGEDRSG
jgi:plasmid stabilization system protein ParE